MQSEKITKTVRLTPEINNRLVELCDHLGVNVNAYLICKIGEAISRDEVAFKAHQHAVNSQAEMSNFFQMMNGLVAEESEKQGKLIHGDD